VAVPRWGGAGEGYKPIQIVANLAVLLTHCGQSILRKICKFDKMSDFKAKCAKFYFCWGSTPDPAGGAYSAPPDPLAVFKGPTSKGMEEEEGEGTKRR